MTLSAGLACLRYCCYPPPQVLAGDNAVYCERCKAKAATQVVPYISRLPELLVIHLKRFDIDFTTMETIKVYDRCSFPRSLNMFRFTRRGIGGALEASYAEASNSSTATTSTATATSGGEGGGTGGDAQASRVVDVAYDASECTYNLVGVLVHSGKCRARYCVSDI